VGALLAYLSLAVVGVVAWLVATRVLHLGRAQVGAVLLCVVLSNTGYLGLPLVSAMLGSDQLAYAIAYDSAVSAPMFFVVAMTIGAVMGVRNGGSRRDLVAGVLRNPPLIAVVAGLLAPGALAPDALLDVAHAFVYAMIPLAFFIVGLSLGAASEEGQLTFPPALSAPVVSVLGLRLLVAPLLMIGLAMAVHDVPDAYLVQAAMPCGANAVLVAHLYGLDRKITSSAVVWSTMLVLVAAVVVSPIL
jgi:predicted permease